MDWAIGLVFGLMGAMILAFLIFFITIAGGKDK